MSAPVDVAYVKAERLLRVTWADDFIAELPAEYLRAWCPCAGCQGHAAVIRYRPTEGRQAIEAMWEVGAYAVCLPFDVADEIEARDPGGTGFGSVRVEVTCGATTWRTSVFPDTGRATYVLPMKRAVRDAEGLAPGDTASIRLRPVDV